MIRNWADLIGRNSDEEEAQGFMEKNLEMKSWSPGIVEDEDGNIVDIMEDSENGKS